MDMHGMTREDIIDMMDAEIDFAIDDQGWCGADGHWITHEELAGWTDEDYIKEYERVYLKSKTNSVDYQEDKAIFEGRSMTWECWQK